MAVIIGGVMVLAAVLIGFSMAGGHVHALIHPSEFVTIGGSTFGALVIMSPKKVLIDLFRGVLQGIKGSPYNKALCIDLCKLLYGLARVVRQDGVLGLESHVGSPETSTLFAESPRVKSNPHLKHFICEAFNMLIDGKPTPEQLQEWIAEEIEVVSREHHAATGALVKTADALPGFGIVAAVLGIVVTMQAIGGPVEEIGHKVGAALVGTFLGILMAYGFFAPMAGRMESIGEQEIVFLNAVSTGVIAVAEGISPRELVVRVRRTIGTDCRPNAQELKQIYGQ
jgi:chemotaxis protein MotA